MTSPPPDTPAAPPSPPDAVAPEHAPAKLLSGLLGQALQYLSATVVGAALAYALVAVLTRLMTPAEYGAFALFQAIATFMTALCALNFPAAANRYLLEPDADTPAFLKTNTAFLLFVGALVAAAAWGLRGPLSAWLDLEGALVFAGVLVGLFRVPWVMMWKVMTAQLRARLYSGLSVVKDLAIFLATVAGAWWMAGGSSLGGAVHGATLSTAIIGVVVLLWLFSTSRGGRASRAHLGYAARFGLPLIPATLATTALNLLDRVVIQATLGADQTAVYAFAYNIGMVMSVALVAVVTAAGPVFTRLHEQGAEPEVSALFSRVGLLLSALALGLVLFSREAAAILGDARYAEGLHIVPWVVLGYLARAFAALYMLYAVFHKRTGINGGGTVVAAVVNGALNVWLVPIYGYAAAAWTTYASFVLFLLWQIGATRWVLKEQGPPFTRWLPLFLGASVGLPLLDVGIAAIEDVWVAVAVKIVGLLVAAAAAWPLIKRRGKLG